MVNFLEIQDNSGYRGKSWTITEIVQDSEKKDKNQKIQTRGNFRKQGKSGNRKKSGQIPKKGQKFQEKGQKFSKQNKIQIEGNIL